MLPWLLIAVPIWFNLFYGLLAWRFSYPGILREPTEVILSRFRAGGSGLILTWWFFALGAIAFTPVVVLSAQLIPDPTLAIFAVVVGITAALVQVLGLLRWVFLVPYLARESASGADPKTVDLVFQSFHRYLGVAVGEHLGYLTTGLWTILLAAGLQLAGNSLAITIPGYIIGAMLLIGTLEFVGPFEKNGWKVAGILVPVGYILWSVWLVVIGVVLLIEG
jgi:hypothetical protein